MRIKKSEPKGSIPNLFMDIFNSVQYKRIAILIIVFLFFKSNDIAFGFPQVQLGHQFLPVYFGKDRMVRTLGIGLWDTLYTRWSFGINVRFQSYRNVFKNKDYPECEPPQYTILAREYIPYVTVDYAVHELDRNTRLYAGSGLGVLVITRQNLTCDMEGCYEPPGYAESDFEVPKPHAWITPYVGVRYNIPTRDIILSLSLGFSHGFGHTELNNYLLLLGSIVLFVR